MNHGMNTCWRPTSAIVAAAFVAILLWGEGAAAGEVALPEDQSIYLQAEVFVALFNDAATYSNIAGGLGFAGRAGWRTGTRKGNAFGLFGQFERNYWLSSEIEFEITPGVLNLGMGAEYLFFDEHLRMSVATGPSILVFDTIFHDKGTTGFFVDVRPACLRWAPLDWLIIELCIINFSLMSPVLGDVSIRKIEYRTILTLEVPL